MIIKLLSDSKQIMWDQEEDIEKCKAHVLLDENEYFIYTILASRGCEIWLEDPIKYGEITSGELYDIIYAFWCRDTTIFEKSGKKGEIYFFDDYEIFPIQYFNYDGDFVYNKDLNDFNILAELIKADPNAIKYLDKYLNEKEFLEGDLDLWELEKIPEILYNIISKLRGSLTLESVETLTDDLALVLSKQRGDLNLPGIKSIADTAAEYLSKHLGSINLSGLESVSDISADHLSKHIGILNLERLENISKEAVICLLNHKGSIICRGEFYNEYRKCHNSSVKYDKVVFKEYDLSIIYLNIVPQNGICIDFIKNADFSLDVVLGKNNAIPIMDFLQAFELSSIEILNLFNIHFSQIKNNKESISQSLGKRFAERVCRNWTEDFVNEDSGEKVSIERTELLYNVNDVITNKAIEVILELPIENILILDSTSNQSEVYFKSKLRGSANSFMEGQNRLYKAINSEDAWHDEATKEFAESFASGTAIDLGSEARKSLNNLLKISESRGVGLYKSDYIEIVRYLIHH